MQPQTIAEALNRYYEETQVSKVSQLQTGLLRFCVPIWGGPTPQGMRSKAHEVDAGLKYLESVSIEKLWDVMTAQEAGFEKMKASEASRRNYRAAVRALVSYGEQQGWRGVTAGQENSSSKPSARQAVSSRPVAVTYWEDVVEQRHSRYGRKKQGNVVRLEDSEIDQVPGLRAELTAFEEHLRPLLGSERTLASKLNITRKFLGWKTRYDQTPLTELSLACIVPYVRMKYDLLDFIPDDEADLDGNILIQEMISIRKAMRAAEAKAQEMEAMFTRYHQGYGRGTKASTLVTEIDGLISIAKFLYRKDTKYPTSSNAFSDIPAVMTLKRIQTQLRMQAKQETPLVPFVERSVPWERVPELLEGLKRYTEWEVYTTPGKSPRTRRDQVIAIDVQRLLMALFFTAIPPRRPRVIRELQVREATAKERVNTLERGLIEPGRGFIPERMLADKQQARWIMRLRDYKTHKTYGDQDIEVFDYVFADGTRFYTYLDLWLNRYRKLFNPVGDHLFVTTTKRIQMGERIGDSSFGDTVRRMTAKVLGVAITPREFRSMYVTHIMGRNDLSENERRAIAWAMGHSLDMQEGTYDKTTSDAYRTTLKRCHLGSEGA